MLLTEGQPAGVIELAMGKRVVFVALVAAVVELSEGCIEELVGCVDVIDVGYTVVFTGCLDEDVEGAVA